MAQDALGGFAQVDGGGVEIIAQLGLAGHRTVHARRLAEQHVERHVHRLVAEVAVGDGQVLLLGGLADHRERAALALADGLEGFEVGGVHRHDIAFLRLVAPDFQRAHARLVVRYRTQLEAAAAAAVVDQFRQGVGDAAGADVVDELDRVVLAHLPAAVDDLLAAALHFRVLALHRGEVEVGGAGAGRHRGCGTAAEADQHGRAAQHDELGADADLALLHVLGADVAHAAGDHDRLVVAAHFLAARGGNGLLEGTEVAGQVRTAEFVVERGAAQRALDHDVQRGDDALGLAVRHFPGLLETGDLQVGDGEADQPGLRLGAAAGGAFVADLAAGAGGGAGERSDGGRVVVRLHLHQDVHRLVAGTVLAVFRIGVEAAGDEALHHRGVVLVGGQHAVAVHFIGVLDHAEQALFLSLAVDVPTGVEDLVAAVFGVGLGEHHQLDVVRVAAQLGEALHQVVDLVLGQRQAQFDVGLLQRRAAAAEHVDDGERLGLGVAEQAGSLFQAAQDQLGHAVVQARRDELRIGFGEFATDVVGDAALDPLDLRQAAVGGDVRGLARPRRNGAEARHHQEQAAAGLLHRDARTVLEQATEDLFLLGGQYAADLGEVRKLGVQPGDSGYLLGQQVEQFAVAEGGKGGSAAQDQHCRNSLWRRGSMGAGRAGSQRPCILAQTEPRRHPQRSPFAACRRSVDAARRALPTCGCRPRAAAATGRMPGTPRDRLAEMG
ncbi:hypothetical protein D9M68_359910 [compost metagenome]